MIKFFTILFFLSNLLNAIILTIDEKKFLQKHPTITLGGDKNWLPYIYKKANGDIEGFDKEILDEVNKLTGANFQIKVGNWESLVLKAKNKEIDGITTSSVHKEREKYFNFSTVYISHDIDIVVKYGNPKNINQIKDLIGKTVVIQKGNLFSEKLVKKMPGSKIIYKDSSEDIIYELLYGNADAAIGNGTTQYLKNKFELPYLTKAFSFNKKHELVFSIRKDWPEAMRILNKGLININKEKLSNMKKKLFEKINFKTKTGLTITMNELKYINKKQKLNICSDPTWVSLRSLKKDIYEKNISTKYMHIILNKIGLKEELIYAKTWEESLRFIKEKKCDIILSIQKTKERSKYIGFTSPYVEYPLMIVTHKDSHYLSNMNILNNKKIAILNKHAAAKLFKEKYTSSKIVYIENPIEALKKVASGEVYGFIELLPILIPIINEFDNIKINREIDINLNLSIGVRKDDKVLLSILEKSLNSIPKVEKIRMFKDLIKVTYNKDKYQNLLYGLLILVLIIITILYWNIQLKKGIKKALVKNKKQQSLLYHFSKHHAMKDLVRNISHQWKEPINELSGLVMHIETKQMLKQEVSKELVKSTMERSRNIIDFMSETVETFNNYYKMKDTIEIIYIDKILKDVIFMLKGCLEENDIKINLEIDKDIIKIYGNTNSLKQVILSIINNAIDILKKREIKSPNINILVLENKSQISILIKDNGLGIKKDNLDKIFSISFTTTKFGSGIGLYISKKIIEEKFKGSINVHNDQEGACFSICIPKE